MKAACLYKEAGTLRQPEAMCIYAAVNEYGATVQKFNLSFLDPLPINRINEVNREKIKAMWELFDMAAGLDWICPFLIFHAKQAEKLFHFLPISNVIVNAVKRREKGETLKLEYKRFLKNCSNQDCPFNGSNDPKMVVLCNRCLDTKKKYCTTQCKL